MRAKVDKKIALDFSFPHKGRYVLPTLLCCGWGNVVRMSYGAANVHEFWLRCYFNWVLLKRWPYPLYQPVILIGAQRMDDLYVSVRLAPFSG